MRGLDHRVFGVVDKCPLLLGEVAPQNEHKAVALLTEDFDHTVGESLPAVFGVGIRSMCPSIKHNQFSVHVKMHGQVTQVNPRTCYTQTVWLRYYSI